MRTMNKPILTILLLAVVCGAVVVRAQEAQKPATLKFKVPAGWVEEERSSAMRVAQYKLPRTEGDTEDGSLVLYYFGKGQGGSTMANIERWASQMQTPEGAAKEKMAEESFTANGLKITAVDAKGTYVAETAPGSGAFHNKPGYRLRAAVIETPNGSYFVKFVGPEKTVTHWDESFLSYLRSFEFK